MVWKGSMKDSRSYELIEEVESFRKRQELPGKCFWMSEVSRGLKKCTDTSEWCREAQKVQKGVKFGKQEGAGKLQGRILSGRRCET